MKTKRGYHILFGFSIFTLTALGVWWVYFFFNSVKLEQEAYLDRVRNHVAVEAMRLGVGVKEPVPGPLEGHFALEIIRHGRQDTGEIYVQANPHFPQFGVRPSPSVLEEAAAKQRRRQWMVIGEGSLLMVLLGVCTFMLYDLVRQERRHMRRMESFVFAVSHEMKTPLAGIKSMLQTFAQGTVPEGEAQRLYTMGLKEAERLEHMVENVLISGRLRTERYKTVLDTVALRSLVEGFVEHRRRYMVGHPESFRLAWDAPEPDLAVEADPGALRVILENLTDNAFKYGGKAPQVTLRVEAHNGSVLLSIEDQGIGFDPSKSQELFVAFRRALKGEDVAQHGTGLGLAIARTLAARMAGKLTAESAGPGKGSRFTLWLKEARS